MSDKLFKSIGEVSKELDVATHILRFWEDNFKNIRPVRRTGGRRYYHVRDVEFLHKIKDLLYKQGYTIKGVQKLLRQESGAIIGESHPVSAPARRQEDGNDRAVFKNVLTFILSDLKALKSMLS